jgi:DNA-binding transcriptional LysR family regulator
MDLRHLTTFRAVVRRGSFSGAAAEVGISQPAVSAQIRVLEDRFGHRLLDRSGRQVTLTDAGRVLDGYAQQLIDLDGDLERAMGAIGEHVAGPLALGSSTGPGEVLLPRLLGAFQAQHPSVVVRLVVHDTQRICEMVLASEIELGVVGAERARSGLVFEPLLRDELVVIAPPGHALASRSSISLTELLTHPMIVQQEGSGVRSVVEVAARAAGIRSRDIPCSMELGLQQSVKAAVLDGLGITVVSRLAVERELTDGRLVAIEVEGEALVRDFVLVRHAGKTPSTVSEAFIAYARGEIAAG